MPIPPYIRVGQRLIAWDGTPGHVTLNSQGVRLHGPGESFKVAWKGEGEEYYTLEDFEEEGITFGRGVMPWAR